MKITVRVENQRFEAEVGDLNARPIVVSIEGQTFDVWPEEEAAEPVQAAPLRAAPAPRPAVPPVAQAPARTDVVRAPIPGVILSIKIQAGENVARGQELCILEAMKMNNTIRAVRDGKIGCVRVGVGQHVAHGDVLMEYEA